MDGILDPGEWSDATPIAGVRDWVAEFSPVLDPGDLSLRGWVKHDSTALYFAFEITDDVLYGIDTGRWLPTENPGAHTLSREGFPWFGDELELLLNAGRSPDSDADPVGDGRSWQMVCNLTKSRLGGIGTGGLLEGEPRSSETAWNTYRHWIESGAQQAQTCVDPSGHRYVIEWAIRFNPCVEQAPGRFYSPADGPTDIGLNIAVGDLDNAEDGIGNFGRFHHEQWWAGAPHTRTRLNNYGTLRLMGSRLARPSPTPLRPPR